MRVKIRLQLGQVKSCPKQPLGRWGTNISSSTFPYPLSSPRGSKQALSLTLTSSIHFLRGRPPPCRPSTLLCITVWASVPCLHVTCLNHCSFLYFHCVRQRFAFPNLPPDLFHYRRFAAVITPADPLQSAVASQLEGSNLILQPLTEGPPRSCNAISKKQLVG